MAYKFLQDKDFIYKIRQEILKVIGQESEVKLFVAENAALAQIKQYIGHRYDTVAIFGATGDDRDAFIIQIVIVIMLYQLYTQTGMKDIPAHRKEEYGDALEWLKEVGNGTRDAVLPSLINETTPGDIRLNSQEQQSWDY